MLYRIYTEDKNKKKLEKVVSKLFPGFTVIKGTGFWRLQKENSLIIEIILPDPSDEKIKDLAKAIKKVNKQESVLVQKIRNEQWFV